ncbi:MAG TPA: hypothetical protein DEH78_18395 [Solibacterales bacterium]|nr:hypothetical protein [Bryobacterales bacterium]
MSVSCPLDCEYLQQAREFDRVAEVDPKNFPNADIEVSDKFLRENEMLLLLAASTVFTAAMSTEGAVDSDVREALDSLVKTYRTAQSGLIYESLPNNPIAAMMHRAVQQHIDDFRRQLAERQGMNTIRDATLLGLLVFLQRLEIQHNNGRRRGRAFIHFLGHYFAAGAAGLAAAEGEQEPPASPLIVP